MPAKIKTNTKTNSRNSHTKKQKPIHYEFGGPIPVFLLIVWSHYILYYFFICLDSKHGSLWFPDSLSPSDMFIKFPADFCRYIYENAFPTMWIFYQYSLFFFSQLLLAAYVPGFTVYGFPVKQRKNKRLPYLINGYACYYITLSVLLIMHVLGIFRLQCIIEEFGQWLTVSVIFGNITSVYWYVFGFVTKQTEKMTGNIIYDFFMGSLMYPRVLGIVDIKMVSEARWSWLSLFVITVSCTLKEYDLYGTVSYQMLFMCVAHWLYSNATVKGEHYIPYFWDMWNEKYGWMLNFWNIAGVPFLYCFQSVFVFKNHSRMIDHEQQYWTSHPLYLLFCFAFLIAGYCIWDIANAQKADFKQPELRKYNTKFPVLCHGLNNPKCIRSPNGVLLVDGFWKYARKMNYTGDLMMSLSWGLVCGFFSSAPYFYIAFFLSFLMHRQFTRDEPRCAKKYGKHWKQYTKQVPNVLIPYVF